MASMWQRGGLSWWQVARRTVRQMNETEMLGRCSELAYVFLFSVFPLLLFLTALLGYMAGTSLRLRASLFSYVARLSPSPDVTALLHNTLDQIARSRGGAKLSLSLLAAIWVASHGMLAIARTLNAACGLKESRPWWLLRANAILLTIAFAVFVAGAVAIMFYSGRIGEALADQLGIGSIFVAAWHVLKWPLVVVFLLLSFDTIYNFAPDLGRNPPRAWGTPGAVIGVALWLAASAGFRFYIQTFSSYTATYGSLGAVIVMLTWFYLTALAILLGGEVNSQITGHISRAPAERPRRKAVAGAAAAGTPRRKRR